MESFRKIEEDHSKHFFGSGKADKIERDIMGRMGFYQFVGKTLELYIVRLTDTLTQMMGAKDADSHSE